MSSFHKKLDTTFVFHKHIFIVHSTFESSPRPRLQPCAGIYVKAFNIINQFQSKPFFYILPASKIFVNNYYIIQN